MLEIGIDSSLVHEIIAGEKTVEGRLGKPKFLKIRAGDTLSIREDIWENGEIIRSVPKRAKVVVEQVLYFESFKELFESIDYKQAIPSAKSVTDALSVYQQFYSQEDEYEFGVVAFIFKTS